MKFLVAQSTDTRINSGDILSVFNLTSPYDVSTCVLATLHEALDDAALTNGSQAGDYLGNKKDHRVQALEINDDGTKLFLTKSETLKYNRFPRAPPG